MDESRKCSECKWFREETVTAGRNRKGTISINLCDCPEEDWAIAETARQKSGCGSSGRYWEPKEDA